MAYAFGKGQLKLDPENINQNMGGRYGENNTYPEGIVAYLSQQGINTRTYFLGFLSDKLKLDWIKAKLESGDPVILVVGNADYLHYITVLGFKDNTLYEYDSLLEKSEGIGTPGNLSENYLNVMRKFKAASFNGAFLNLAISG